MAKNTPVSLDDNFAGFIDSQVKSSHYGSAGDVVRTEPGSLEEHESEIEALQDALIEGERSGVPQPFDRDGFLKRMHDRHIG